jgi:hypothetical protein
LLLLSHIHTLQLLLCKIPKHCWQPARPKAPAGAVAPSRLSTNGLPLLLLLLLLLLLQLC